MENSVHTSLDGHDEFFPDVGGKIIGSNNSLLDALTTCAKL
jgi:hypothetical protein